MRKYRNPFLPSPAQKALRESVKDYKIWFHMLEYGEPVGDGFYSIEKMASALLPAIQNKTESATLREGIAIFKEATHFNCWRKSYTKPINDAMDVVNRRFFKLPVQIKQKSIKAVFELEAA